MATFDTFLQSLKTAVSQYAQKSWSDYSTEAVNDGQAFIDQTKQDLQNWTQQLVAGGITAQDLEFNLKSKTALAQLTALKQRGLAKVALDNFTSGLVDVIVNTATSTFL